MSDSTKNKPLVEPVGPAGANPAGADPVGDAIAKRDLTDWPLGIDVVPIHFAGRVVPATYAQVPGAAAGHTTTATGESAAAGQTCIALKIRSDGHASPRAAGRVVSRVVEPPPASGAAPAASPQAPAPKPATPVANAPAPVADAPAPATNANAPVANATAPVAKGNAPAAKATAPVAHPAAVTRKTEEPKPAPAAKPRAQDVSPAAAPEPARAPEPAPAAPARPPRRVLPMLPAPGETSASISALAPGGGVAPPAVPPPPTTVADRNESDPPAPGQELMKFHRMMRGRYRWAAVLAVIGLIGGALAGWRLGKQTFMSQAIIHVQGFVPPVMSGGGEAGILPMLESFVEAQANILRGQRVMEMAVIDGEWVRVAKRGVDDKAKLKFAESVTVTTQKEMIRLQVVDDDPIAARLAVKTLIDKYNTYREAREKTVEEARSGKLRELERARANQLAQANQTIADLVKKWGTNDIRAEWKAKDDEGDRLLPTIEMLQLELDGLKKDPTARAREAAELTEEQIATRHPRMAQLLVDRATRMEQLDATERRQGKEHRETVDARDRLQKANDEIAALVTTVRERYAKGMSIDGQPGAANEALLAKQLSAYRGRHKEVTKDLAALNDAAVTLELERDRGETARRELDEVRQRIQALDVEKPITSRISTPTDGDKPLGPHRDTRITFAAAGALGGAMLGFGLIAAMALCDGRLRSPDEAVGDGSGLPILGLLPRLSLDLADPQEAATAAHCVHEIRTLLQVCARSRDQRVFAVTSPNPGTGKTSLTLALGAAYALAGQRTLLIDGDLVGAGLTTRVDAIIRRRIGRILRSEGLVTQGQLDEALRLSKQSAARLGEILVQLGYLNERDLNRAILLQQNDDQPIGLIDALNGHEVEECVVELGIDNLWVLPAGSADARYVPALSPDGMQRLIQSARQKFDIVLIDTGPLPGSLEARIVTALADGAILTVSKGEYKSLVQRSLSQLESVGARVVGVVFNRASPNDVSRYGSSSGASLRSGQSLNRGGGRYVPVTSAARLGPLAHAVASFAPGGASAGAASAIPVQPVAEPDAAPLAGSSRSSS